MIIQYHNGINDSSAFKFQIICEKKTRMYFDREQCLRLLAPIFFVSADSRLSIPYENFFTDSVFDLNWNLHEAGGFLQCCIFQMSLE